MGKIEYALVPLKDDLYLDDAAQALGLLLERCVEDLGLRGAEVEGLFVLSGLAKQFEIHNPKYVSGMTSLELCEWAVRACGLQVAVPRSQRFGTSESAWVGKVLAYAQARSGVSYQKIFEAVSFEEQCARYFGREEWSIEEASDDLVRLVLGRQPVSRLKLVRKTAGLTQQQLSAKSGVSLRAIQQYEQGSKDINRAAADSLRRLARVLGCTMEDLMNG